MNPEVALPQKKSPPEYRRAAEMREAMGVSEGQAEREALSTVPSQSAEALPEASGRAGRKLGVTDEDIQRRNEYIIGLALMGLTVRTILQRANAQSAVTGWGIIESEKTIHRIVSEHYQAVRLRHAGDVQAFEQATPRILHGIFQTLSKAMALHGSITPPAGLSRMADFEQWGCAIAEALGYTAAEFTAAYERNVGVQTQAAIDESDVAQSIVALMEREQADTWEGTASKLLEELTEIAAQEKINTKDPSWPKRGSALSKRIRTVLSNLRDVGIHVSFPRDGRSRRVHIQKIGSSPSSPVTTWEMPMESQNDGDGTREMVSDIFGHPSQDSSPEEAKNNENDRSDGGDTDLCPTPVPWS